MAWERQAPVFLENLGKGSGFLRADGATKVGINRGFAIPCGTLDGSHYVMTFLSALATPIAQRVEIWQPDPGDASLDKQALACTYRFAEPADESPTHWQTATAEGAHALIQQAFASGVPTVQEPMIAIPIAPHGGVTAVMALYF